MTHRAPNRRSSHARQQASRRGERGSVMLVVMILLAALLVAGGYALFLQLSSTRSSGLVDRSRAALYCAEAGLAAARNIIGPNYPLWDSMLDNDPSNDPPWYPITGDIDGDGVPDYRVIIRDNDDEVPPTPNDPTHDNDLKVFVVSTCTKYPDVPRTVEELVSFQRGAGSYRNQAGHGAGNTGNTN